MPKNTVNNPRDHSAMSPALRFSVGVNLVLVAALGVVLWRGQPAAAPAHPATVRSSAQAKSAAASGLPLNYDGTKLIPARHHPARRRWGFRATS